MNLDHEITVATETAREAAALVRGYQGRVSIDHKGGGEPVTEADRAASRLIVAALQAAFPEDGILSEELPDDGSRLRCSRVWMIDPIDGTRDFINGHQGYAVMIGLCIEGRPQLGIVSQPPTGLTWGGIVGQGAWKEEADGSRRKLEVSSLRVPTGIRLVASKSHRSRDIDMVRQALAIDDEINVGGVGLKVGLVAEGSRDLYVYPGGQTKKWDSCAPEAILLAAGGKLTDLSGKDLSYVGQDLHNREGIIASNGHLHETVVATLAKVGDELRALE